MTTRRPMTSSCSSTAMLSPWSTPCRSSVGASKTRAWSPCDETRTSATSNPIPVSAWCRCATGNDFMEIGRTEVAGWVKNGEPVTDVGGNLLRALERTETPWTPLLRSNRVNPHPLWFGIYGESATTTARAFAGPWPASTSSTALSFRSEGGSFPTWDGPCAGSTRQGCNAGSAHPEGGRSIGPGDVRQARARPGVLQRVDLTDVDTAMKHRRGLHRNPHQGTSHRPKGKATHLSRHVVAVMALVAGLAILATTWALSNPPGASPDEPTSYIKAIGTSLGQWLPQHVTVARNIPRHRFDDANFGAFEVPVHYVPDPRWACNRLTAASARCLRAEPSQPQGGTHRQ